jgi:hypothetical protein
MWKSAYALMLACAALASCDDSSSTGRAQRERKAQRQADEVLIKEDSGKAADAFADRLRNRVWADEGLILVDEPDPVATVHGFPLHVVWHIQCGLLGLSINFSSSSADDASDEVEVALSQARISMDECHDLLPPIAQVLIRYSGRVR